MDSHILRTAFHLLSLPQKKGNTMRMQQKQHLLSILIIAIVVGSAAPFVSQLRPVNRPSRVVDGVLSSSSQRFDEPSQTNLLTRAVDTIKSWVPHNAKKEDEIGRDIQLSNSRQRSALVKETNDALGLLPWPFRAMGRAMTKTVNRALTKEERKTKPLLWDAQRFIQADADLCATLGEPITFGPILSHQSSSTTSRINFRKIKTILIKDSFEVQGAKATGTATMVADKYARGHLQALRVTVGGIAYDVDIR